MWKERVIMDFAAELNNKVKKMKHDLRFGVKPKDCKHCYGASAGVMGVHYSCDCEKSKMYQSYPLIMCPQDCEFYEKEESVTTMQ